ncbi:MAG: cytochrome c family protein [Thermodesulfovibrionales bacterium]|nr:cytochrome c family protein [Thermodesulfovibrionales bacterium]
MRKTLSMLILLFSLLTLLFYQRAGSVSYPKVISLDNISGNYTPVKFDHEKHVLFSTGCSQCHHEHQNNESLSCKDCHNLSPTFFKKSVSRNFIACKNCHSEFNPSVPQIPGLKAAYHRACFQCHRGMDVGIDPKGCSGRCHSLKNTTAERRSP